MGRGGRIGTTGRSQTRNGMAGNEYHHCCTSSGQQIEAAETVVVLYRRAATAAHTIREEPVRREGWG